MDTAAGIPVRATASICLGRNGRVGVRAVAVIPRGFRLKAPKNAKNTPRYRRYPPLEWREIERHAISGKENLGKEDKFIEFIFLSPIFLSSFCHPADGRRGFTATQEKGLETQGASRISYKAKAAVDGAPKLASCSMPDFRSCAHGFETPPSAAGIFPLPRGGDSCESVRGSRVRVSGLYPFFEAKCFIY
jgi:hypothetical protein